MRLLRGARVFLVALVLAGVGSAVVSVQPAEAAPYWCRAWHVSGQTWYGSQSNGYSLLFTLRSSPPSQRFSGYARYHRGDVNLGGTPSQRLSGSVSSESVGRVIMNIVWRDGPSGQYIATVTRVRRTSSGGLTAGLRGTTVDTTGGVNGGSAGWEALGLASGPLPTGRYLWPLFCPREYVVRYPA